MTVTTSILKKVRLFSELSHGELMRVANITQTKTFPAGEVIFPEGEVGKEVYVILSGQVKITKKSRDGESQPLSILKPGEAFGEMSLFTGLPHSATSEALEPVEVLVLKKEIFDRFAAANPGIGYKIAKQVIGIVADVLRDMNNRFMEMMNYLWRWR